MNPPQVYMCSPSWTLFPPPSPFHPSGSSQCTSPKHPVSYRTWTGNSFHTWYFTCFNAILPNLPTLVQLSHPYMTTGKNKALTRRTFVDKIMSLLFNMPSRLVIAFLPRSKCLLISWLQSLSTVILEPKKIKSVTVSPSICHEVMGLDAMILVFWML